MTVSMMMTVMIATLLARVIPALLIMMTLMIITVVFQTLNRMRALIWRPCAAFKFH